MRDVIKTIHNFLYFFFVSIACGQTRLQTKQSVGKQVLWQLIRPEYLPEQQLKTQLDLLRFKTASVIESVVFQAVRCKKI